MRAFSDWHWPLRSSFLPEAALACLAGRLGAYFTRCLIPSEVARMPSLKELHRMAEPHAAPDLWGKLLDERQVIPVCTPTRRFPLRASRGNSILRQSVIC